MEEMDSIRQIFRENPDYLVLLSEPSIPKTERVALLNKAFDGQIQPYLLNFLGILCENGALREFGGCCDARATMRITISRRLSSQAPSP